MIDGRKLWQKRRGNQSWSAEAWYLRGLKIEKLLIENEKINVKWLNIMTTNDKENSVEV